MTFTKEADFEEALVHELKNKGWEHEVLTYPSEADLLKNWANILFENNRDIDRLNDTSLTTSEMQQIVEQITDLKTPLKLNGFINLEKSVGSRILAQPIDSTELQKNAHLTEWVRLRFF